MIHKQGRKAHLHKVNFFQGRNQPLFYLSNNHLRKEFRKILRNVTKKRKNNDNLKTSPTIQTTNDYYSNLEAIIWDFYETKDWNYLLDLLTMKKPPQFWVRFHASQTAGLTTEGVLSFTLTVWSNVRSWDGSRLDSGNLKGPYFQVSELYFQSIKSSLQRPPKMIAVKKGLWRLLVFLVKSLLFNVFKCFLN